MSNVAGLELGAVYVECSPGARNDPLVWEGITSIARERALLWDGLLTGGVRTSQNLFTGMEIHTFEMVRQES